MTTYIKLCFNKHYIRGELHEITKNHSIDIFYNNWDE